MLREGIIKHHSKHCPAVKLLLDAAGARAGARETAALSGEHPHDPSAVQQPPVIPVVATETSTVFCMYSKPAVVKAQTFH